MIPNFQIFRVLDVFLLLWTSGGVEQSACVTYIVQGASSGMSWHLTPLERTAWEKYFGLLCKSECWECGTGQTGAFLLDTHPPSSHGVSWIKKNVRGHQWLFCLTWCLRRDVTWPGPYKIIAHREILRSSPIFHKSSTKHPPLACMFIKYQIIKKNKITVQNHHTEFDQPKQWKNRHAKKCFAIIYNIYNCNDEKL